MENRWISENKPILTKCTLHAHEGEESETVILRQCDLRQSDVDVITENFAYATYLDLSYNEKIEHIKFLLTPKILNLRNCTNLREIKYRFSACTLRTLDIAGCPIDYETHFTSYDFPFLQDLTVSWRPKIEWHRLLGDLKALQNLTIEELYCTSREHTCSNGIEQERESVSLTLFTALTECKNITCITLGGIPCERDIRQLKKLTDQKLGFHIRHFESMQLQRLGELQNLSTLYLERVENVTDADLLSILRSCVNLKKITLDYCAGVTKELIFKAAEFLRERDKNLPLKARLNLEICGCAGIGEDIQEHPLYAKAESALSLILYFKCQHPETNFRNDLIIPYPAPNVQLSIYILFEIYKKLLNQPAAQRFATVCADFESAAIEEERHLKIIACRRAKVVRNEIYDAYLKITTENQDFFTNAPCMHAMKMVLSNRLLMFDTIFVDFPLLKRVKLINCVVEVSELPKERKYCTVSELEICGANALRLWQALASLFPSIATVHLSDELLETTIELTSSKSLSTRSGSDFRNVQKLSIVGSILSDDDVEFLANLTNLKSLSILRNSKITGKYIAELSTIEDLQLNCCENLNQYYIADIVSSLPLRALDLRRSTCAITATHLTNEMWLHCTMLTELKIDWQEEQTATLLRILQTLHEIEVRNIPAYSCSACLRHELLAIEPPNLRTGYQRCTCLAEPQTRIVHTFFRTLIARTRITKLTLEAEVLCRNLNYLQLMQWLTHLSVVSKKTTLDVFRIAPNFYQTIGQLRNLVYLYFARFYYCYDGVIHIVGCCAKLRELRLKECVGFSDVVVYDLAEVLQRKRTKEQLPLNFFMQNFKDESSDAGSEASSGAGGTQDVKRFEDVKDYIKVNFI